MRETRNLNHDTRSVSLDTPRSRMGTVQAQGAGGVAGFGRAMDALTGSRLPLLEIVVPVVSFSSQRGALPCTKKRVDGRNNAMSGLNSQVIA